LLRIAGDLNGNTLGVLSEIGFGSSAGPGSNSQADTLISSVKTNVAGFGYSDLYFSTRSSAANAVPIERIRIAAVTGFMGVGTSSPSSLLTLSGSNSNTTLTTYQTSPNLTIINRDQTNNNEAPLDFRLTNSAGTEISGAMISGIFTDHTSASENGDLAFHTMNNGSFSEKMRIKDSGNVGIGTTSPLARLDVAGANNGTSPLFQITSVASFATTTRFIVDSSGNVGIGTSTPNAKFEVSSLTNQALFTSNDSRKSILINYDNATNVASIGVEDGYGSAPLTFRDNGAERMRITATGNVGVGTTSPSSILHIYGLDPVLTIQNNRAAAVGNVSEIALKGLLSTGADAFIGRITGIQQSTGSNTGDVAIKTYNGGSLGEVARFTSAGNVGIGTTTPVNKLTVAGDIGLYGTIPTITSAGISPSIRKGSTDTAGEITEGSASTGAVITFATVKTNIPFCTLSSEAGLLFSYSVSTSAITITNIGALSSTAVTYHCIQSNN